MGGGRFVHLAGRFCQASAIALEARNSGEHPGAPLTAVIAGNHS